MILRTVLRATCSSRSICLMDLPCTKYARRTRAIVSTPFIPQPPVKSKTGSLINKSRGSKLDADYPHNGVNFARRNTDLAANGLTVLLSSRNLERGQLAAQTIAGDVHPIQLDVTDNASIRAAVTQVEQQFGHLDILINNAAISRANGQES